MTASMTGRMRKSELPMLEFMPCMARKLSPAIMLDEGITVSHHWDHVVEAALDDERELKARTAGAAWEATAV